MAAAEGQQKDVDAYEATAFEALEKDFQEVLQELIGDKSLEHFRLEYEKLHRALKKSHESEKRLIKKCRELNTEIVSNAAKVQMALNLSKEDQSTIGNLKKEIERAWKMVEASHEKEQRAKEAIHNLKVEIANLSHLVEQGAGLSISQENTVNSLVSQRDELKKTRDKLDEQVNQITQDNISLTETYQKLEAEKVQGDVDIANAKDMLQGRRIEAEREHRRWERLTKNLQDLKQSLDGRDKTLRAVRNDIRVQDEQKEHLDQQLLEQSRVVEGLRQDEAKLEQELDEMRRSNQAEDEGRRRLQQDNLDLEKELRSTIEEIKNWQADKDKLQKQVEQLKRRKALDEDERHEVELSRAILKTDVENLLREIELLKKQVDSDNKIAQDIMRERDLLNRGVLKADDRTKKQSELVKQYESRSQTLESEVNSVKHELQDAVKKVYELDKAREKYGIECSLTNSKYMAALEELKNRDNKTSELKKNYASVKAKLVRQKQLYENVRTERNLFSKNLVESQDEIAEMKTKFKIMSHQIEQLKEEIKEKEEQLKSEHKNLNDGQRDCDQAKEQKEKAKRRHKQLDSLKETQQGEMEKLNARIREADAERQQQKKAYEALIVQRDNLGTQLIRRNDELALLYEKIKIQQRTLQNGEISYKQRVEESRALGIHEGSLKRELQIAKQQVTNIVDLKREVFQLQRELLRERTKVKALSEELENPLNVHRWRKLEGADPALNEIMQKVTTLQTRLIAKTEEAVEKEMAIHDKQKLHYEMQNLLSKQPGSEIVAEVARQQASVKEKTKVMKAMAAELNMYHAQLNDFKDEIERLTRDLQLTKRRYFEQRNRERLVKDTSKVERNNAPQPTTNQG